MADEKQLTVAELLERNKKAGGSERKPRRRRSLEDGGISVAELTGSFKAVPAAPAQSKHATPIDEGDKTTASKASAGKASESAVADNKKAESAKPESAAADKKQAEAVKKTEPAKPASATANKKKADDTKTVVAPKVQAAKPESATADSTNLKQADKKTPSNDDTSIITKVKEPQVGSSKLGSMVDTSSHDEPKTAEPKTAEPKTEVAKSDADPSDEAPVRSNPWAVTLLSIIGIVLGIAVFVVFDALWGGLAKWLVAILALIVTGAAVLVVRVMRTEKDRQSQILAGVAGLAMTFGPALLHLF